MTDHDRIAGQMNRWTAVSAIGGAAALAMLARSRGEAAPVAGAGARRLDLAALQSDGVTLGMPREAWVSAVGEGERIEAGIGDDLYEYAVQFGRLYVTFREFSDGAFANYIEFGFGSDGLTYDRVEPIVRSMMPSDARATGSYLTPATPSGPTAIASWSYVSEELGSYHPVIPSEFLSMRLQRRGDDAAWLVSSAHLIAGDIMQ